MTLSDEVATLEGVWVGIDEIVETGLTTTVYNFRVADHHTYFLGDDTWEYGVWVHNSYGELSARQLKKYAQTYADKINSNRSWEWSEIGNFSRGQRSSIRQIARENELIENIDKVRMYGPNNQYADFGELAYDFGEKVYVPQRLRKAGRPAHDKYLDEKYFGGNRPEGWTWHHMAYNGEMQLVPFGIHRAVDHKGGMSLGRWGSLITRTYTFRNGR